MLRRLILLLFGLAVSQHSAAQVPSAAAACDGPAWQAVLQPSAGPADARAVWLDAGTLQWPEVQVVAGERFRLLHSAEGRLALQPGQAAEGADAAFALQTSQAADPSRDQRFRHLAAGARLALAADDRARLPALLAGQWVLVREDAEGRLQDATTVQSPGLLDALYAPAAALTDLGATPRPRGSTGFRLWAPTARAVTLCLYPRGQGAAEAAEPLQHDDTTGAWGVTHARDLSGRYYSYLVEVFVPGTGWVRNRVTDPYAVSLTTDSRRTYIADLRDPRLKPAGWDTHAAPATVRANTDMVVYELHVRDFSVTDTSVPAAHRGKYLAFTDTGSRGMRHLRALAQAGLTDVHLLPVFDLASVPEAGCTVPRVPAAASDSPVQQAAVMAQAARDCFNWGYDPFHYSAPEGSYASNAADGAVRIREFRAMVLALHRAGLRVGMDVVYNHTAAAGQHEKSVLDRIVPGYYHRLDATGQVERSTCCDNTATEHAMMAKLMVDSVRLWATQYRIDSFRFDLMAHQPRAVMEALQHDVDAVTGRHVNLIGEGWNFGEVADGRRFVQASQRSLAGAGIGTFSDRGRDAVRGGSAGDDGPTLVERKGWVNGALDGPPEVTMDEAMRLADQIRVGLAGTLRDFRFETRQGEVKRLDQIDYAGQPAGYASQPGEVVNYVENHDNQTLFDNNVLKLPRETPGHERARVQVLAMAINLFSQGVAYFHAGIDTLRSKSLDRNSYDSGDWFNRLDWSYRTNHFGTGLPPQGDNGRSWPVFQPLLAQRGVAPAPADIAFARDAFRDLLAIRASTPLFRLRDAAEVEQRLSFPNSGPKQNPAVIVGRLDGAGRADARFGELAYFVNAATTEQALALPELAGAPWRLHPVHLKPGAADTRPARAARFDPPSGAFTIPPRSAVVFVRGAPPTPPSASVPPRGIRRLGAARRRRDNPPPVPDAPDPRPWPPSTAPG
ncbi:alpha-1,6-glucosidase domain-containing protein [Ideonella sp.]|uniref:alpha-1,6-glucosidase domain-containing protein n=1 Tax=Ideonella sp. TaxID=1929293 RepID=UPI002B49BE9F|nr:alpha-1,6-glucosidase domain-containing protein [Ideonella sp.]HJV70351.1 alpha-1,6-glucosidase domain-containing protein [Ideonella sp.]